MSVDGARAKRGVTAPQWMSPHLRSSRPPIRVPSLGARGGRWLDSDAVAGSMHAFSGGCKKCRCDLRRPGETCRDLTGTSNAQIRIRTAVHPSTLKAQVCSCFFCLCLSLLARPSASLALAHLHNHPHRQILHTEGRASDTEALPVKVAPHQKPRFLQTASVRHILASPTIPASRHTSTEAGETETQKPHHGQPLPARARDHLWSPACRR